MNYKFRKKPVVIEAYQMTRERRNNKVDWPIWLHQAWNKDYPSEGAVWPKNYPLSDGSDQLCIRTLEGVYIVGWDDYIIQGIKGEIYACKPDIFEATYDRVEQGKQTTALEEKLVQTETSASKKIAALTAENKRLREQYDICDACGEPICPQCGEIGTFSQEGCMEDEYRCVKCGYLKKSSGAGR